MLNARNIKTKRPSKGLDYKNLGPFKIVRAISNSAYELKLPQSMKSVFPVFHPWLLHPAYDNPLPGQRQLPPPPLEIDERGDVDEVDEVLDSRIDRRRVDVNTGERGCLMYKLKFPGEEEPPEWQPYWDADGCDSLIADFHHKYPDKPGPHRSFLKPADWTPLLAMLLHD